MSPSGTMALLVSLAVGGMLVRPWRSQEWQWAAGGAAAAIALRIESPGAAWSALAAGASVYALLAGIGLLGEAARRGGALALLAALARKAAGRSQPRLFGLLYAAGIVVTALLSNDTTALVLTPAVLACVESSVADPLPYLYACAFVANAASFVFPFSNPANLVTFAGRLPPLWAWGGAFGLAAVAAIAVTYAALGLRFAAALRSPLAPAAGEPSPPHARATAAALGVAALGMLAAAATGRDVGLAALLLGAAVVALAWCSDRGAPLAIARRFPWQIFPLVAGLFVVVDALDRSGGLAAARGLLVHASHLPTLPGAVATAGAIAAACVLNNLPVAVAVAFAHGDASDRILHASAIGVDLGPNLFASGSLSTLLWMMALRREGIEVGAARFFRIGIIAGLPALLAAALLVR